MSIESDPSQVIGVGPVKLLSLGAKCIPLHYKSPDGQQGPICIQTDFMNSFGINKWPLEQPPEDLTPPKLSVTISFNGQAKLQNFFEKWDKWATKYVFDNMWEILRVKGATLETIQFNYTPIVRVPKDKVTGEPNGNPATMKLKLTRDDKPNVKSGVCEYSAAFFNTDKQLIGADDVEPIFAMGSQVRAMIQCSGFWIAAGKFGITWKLKQMIIKPPVRIGKVYAFDDGEDEDAAEPPAKMSRFETPVPAAADAAAAAAAFDEDSNAVTDADLADAAEEAQMDAVSSSPQQPAAAVAVSAAPVAAKKVVRKTTIATTAVTSTAKK